MQSSAIKIFIIDKINNISFIYYFLDKKKNIFSYYYSILISTLFK